MSAERAGSTDQPVPRQAPATRPLALARPVRAAAPAHQPPETALEPEQILALAMVRRTTDEVHRLEVELEAARQARGAAVVEALRLDLPRSTIGKYACKAGEPALSRRQVNRLAEAQQPWRDQP